MMKSVIIRQSFLSNCRFFGIHFRFLIMALDFLDQFLFLKVRHVQHKLAQYQRYIGCAELLNQLELVIS